MAESKQPTFGERYKWFAEELKAFDIKESKVYHAGEYNIVDLFKYANVLEGYTASMGTGSVLITRIA